LNIVEKIEHFKRYDGMTYPELRQVYKKAVRVLGYYATGVIEAMKHENKIRMNADGTVMLSTQRAKEIQSELKTIPDYCEALQIERDLDQLERYMDRQNIKVWWSTYENIRGQE